MWGRGCRPTRWRNSANRSVFLNCGFTGRWWDGGRGKSWRLSRRRRGARSSRPRRPRGLGRRGPTVRGPGGWGGCGRGRRGEIGEAAETARARSKGAYGPGAEWLERFCTGKSKAWYFYWIAVGHNHLHLGQARWVRKLLLGKGQV